MNTFKRLLVAFALYVGVINLAVAAYPSGPIRLIVGYPPGVVVDSYARIIAEQLQKMHGWDVVVENRPGAGGTLATAFVAKSAPDGQTLVMGQSSSLTIAPLLYKNLRYDPIKSFAPIALISEAKAALVVPVNSPYKTMAEFIEAAKKEPGKLSIASPGTGTSGHLGIELLTHETGAKFNHIPYKGTVQAMNDVVGGRLDGYMATISAASSYIVSNKVRALMIAAPNRIKQMPDVPSSGEYGLADFNASAWWGVLAPANTPSEIVAALSESINQIVKSSEMTNVIERDYATVLDGGPEVLHNLIKSDLERWGAVIKDAGIKLE